jgi:dsRNA-specific ribonuclease
MYVDLPGVEDLLSVRFIDRDLGRIALSPWSFGFSRLEFLGDAMLGLAVFSAAELMGLPRKTATSRVANHHLDKLFYELLTLHTSANTGDVIEALIGAIYLDSGFDEAAAVATRLCLPESAPLLFTASSETISSIDTRGLAFVGSAVLSASVADDLCIKHPEALHQWLSEVRSAMLSRRHLATMSAELGYAPEGDLDDDDYRATASDALEARIGDQYFRWGWEVARSFSMRILRLPTSES